MPKSAGVALICLCSGRRFAMLIMAIDGEESDHYLCYVPLNISVFKKDGQIFNGDCWSISLWRYTNTHHELTGFASLWIFLMLLIIKNEYSNRAVGPILRFHIAVVGQTELCVERL